MSKVIITADSTSDLSNELVLKNNVNIVPLFVNLGDKSLRDDGVEVVPDDIYKYVSETGKLPFTSANPTGLYMDVFTKYVNDGFEVVHLNIGSDLSSSYQNACIAAEEVGNVYVVDTKNLSTGSGHLVLKAAEMAAQGLGGKEIFDKLNELAPKVDASFVIDNLDYLHKGGRCSSVAKLGANLLKLKPCIQVLNGKMGVGKKYRGDYNKCVVEYIKDKLSDVDSIDTSRIFVTHTKCDDATVKAAIDTVNSLIKFDEVIETTAGCTITTHCGPNTLGILFFRKENLQ